MTQAAEHFILRKMQLTDVPQVVSIDRESFTMPWSTRTYNFEISQSDTSHMVVLEATHLTPITQNGWRSLLYRLFAPNTPPIIVGYGGCWLIAGEAHISTIATHPDFRGRGLGELLLAGMLQRSINLGGEYSVLEVRESNVTAQKLYEKYGYHVVGRRRGYYRDDNEDALLMEVRPLDAAYAEQLQRRIAALRQRIPFADTFMSPDQR
ncbi:MAG: ribosomal protein S18-alanine N-acetyltransferase [Anaerolineae bacterium]|nr:ribosomal protein S18-alanine N-acetyltransferase [Anaerolineae bacterium]